MSSTSEEDAPVTSLLPPWLVTGGAASWRLIAMLLLGWAVLQILGTMRLLAVSFLISLVVTALLYPLARWMRSHRVPRVLSAILPLLLLVAVLTAVVGFFARGLARQWDALVESVLDGWEQLRRVVAASPMMEGAFSGDFGDDLATGPIAEQAFRTVYTTAEVVAGIFLVAVFVFFLLRDGHRIGEVLLRLFPRSRRDRARAASHAGWRTLERYIVGIAIVAAVNTVLTGIALLVLEIPMVVPLVLFTFVACFIPFVGTILAIAAGALIALAERGPEIAFFFILAGVGIELLESNVTQPLVQGRVLHVHPLLVVGFVTAGTVVFGLPGAFLAVPLLAVLFGVTQSMKAVERTPETPESPPEPPEGEASPQPESAAPELRPRAEAEQPA